MWAWVLQNVGVWWAGLLTCPVCAHIGWGAENHAGDRVWPLIMGAVQHQTRGRRGAGELYRTKAASGTPRLQVAGRSGERWPGGPAGSVCGSWVRRRRGSWALGGRDITETGACSIIAELCFGAAGHGQDEERGGQEASNHGAMVQRDQERSVANRYRVRLLLGAGGVPQGSA